MKIKNRCVPSRVEVQYGNVHVCSVHDSKKYEYCCFRVDNCKSEMCDFVTSLWGYCQNKDAIANLDINRMAGCRVADWIKRV